MEAFLGESLTQTAFFSVPFVRAALLTDDVTSLDEHLDSFMTNHVARRASRLQGMAFLATVADVFELPNLVALRQHVLRHALPGHYAVIFGAVMRSLDVELPSALRTYLYIAMRGMLSAAVRLGIIGPLEAQRLQTRLDGPLGAAAETGLGLTLADVCQTSPPLELWQMGQDRLYSRLFQS